jgi:hypothetical protein
VSSPPSDLQLEEWKECRTTIGRFDTIISDTRKFGFTLVTGLLAGSALFTGSGQHPDVAATTTAAVVIEALVFSLFLIDRYYFVLLDETVKRALDLEKALPTLRLTTLLHRVASGSRVDLLAQFVYVVVLLLAALLPTLLAGQSFQLASWGFGGFIAFLLVGMGFYGWTERLIRKRP